jgi:5'-nucleotidase
LNILLTNDDGIFAPGIQTLARHLRADGHQITLIAPDRERSAASHSLTLRKDLRVMQLSDTEFSVDGTPVDCVVLALQKLIKTPPELVISGINAGQNMGEDVFYSGTVAAALEASFFGYRSIAVSINSYHDQIYDTAAEWMARMVKMGIADLTSDNTVLNINFPNVPVQDIRGIRLTRVGHRKYYNFIEERADEHGQICYRIGGDKPVWDLHKGTDAEAVSENYISITPLSFEMTRGTAFPDILEWLEENNLLQIEHT